MLIAVVHTCHGSAGSDYIVMAAASLKNHGRSSSCLGFAKAPANRRRSSVKADPLQPFSFSSLHMFFIIVPCFSIFPCFSMFFIFGDCGGRQTSFLILRLSKEQGMDWTGKMVGKGDAGMSQKGCRFTPGRQRRCHNCDGAYSHFTYLLVK